MTGRLQEGRRSDRRAFRPSLADGSGLETRCLLSLARPLSDATLERFMSFRPLNRPNLRLAPIAHTQAANGGRSVVVTDGDGERYQVTVSSILQSTGPTITAGTVHATRLPNGTVGLIVDGTDENSELTINPVIKPAYKGGGHNFASNVARQDGVLHVGFVQVSSGKISSILGYRSAVLDGPIVVADTNTPVNRIAFTALNPGASIQVGNDLNTLDVLKGVNLTTGPGIVVGRDLNWFNTNQDVTLDNGASIAVGRDLGRFLQAAKGTGVGGAGISVLGNFALGTGSTISVGRDILRANSEAVAPIVVVGNLSGASNLPPYIVPINPTQVGPAPPGANMAVFGTITP